jgi:hypothetical protein
MDVVTTLALTVAIFVIAYLGFHIYSLKGTIKDLSVTNNDLGSTISNHIKDASLLRERLTETVDKLNSLQVVINNQTATIKHHEQVIEECAKIAEANKPESTQYPVAPPDLSKHTSGSNPAVKKNYQRDAKGHFSK